MKRQSLPTILAALLLAMVLIYVMISSQSNIYIVMDLNAYDPASSFAFAVNNAGQVAGYTEASQDRQAQGFLYSAGKKRALSDPGMESRANGLNATGIVVGSYTKAGTVTACRFENDKIEGLRTRAGRHSEAEAVNAEGDIVGNSNADGDIVGNSNADGRRRHAFLYKDGSMQDLGTLGGFESEAHGINDKDQIVGTSTTAEGGMCAFLYSNGAMQDLGTLGGDQSYASAINQAGQVVGYSDVPGGATHAFLYQDGRMEDLGTLDQGLSCFAYGINSRGDVVGSSDIGNGTIHAFVYKNGRMRDLNRLIPAHSGWALTEARAINDKGQIVGIGIRNGRTRAFLLTPQ